MLLRDIRDQDHAVDILRRALRTDKVSHAYLFEGPPGVGKHLTAVAMAKALNCTDGMDDACGECGNCRKIDAGVHPDISILTLPEGKRIIPIDSVREVQKYLSVRPHEGKAKVLILDPADALSEPAANALLKTLEEPRPGSFLILVTGRASALLPTVRSRCQSIRFRPLAGETVAKILEDRGIARDEAEIAAALSAGSVERALGMVGDEFEERLKLALGLFAGALGRTPLNGLEVTGQLRGQREEAIAILEVLLGLLDETLWLAGTSSDVSDRDNRPLARRLDERILGFATETNVVRITTFIDAVHEAALGIRQRNWNPQLAVEGMLMTMRGHSM